ncbi:hypothetical protein GYMLUDRAFT_252926 [Collybiopsis luxurians FD-317 M1]|uniref:Uncharacterized protein n=1 Tax=Collybiopsis luxurians FD-317 M1 TaxID=944289 RepID=A0A0D0BM84_9AGAR|nr:hypothetical protein GYMLUDRAFT_252926 [Collybiopsis luxurians FD-317 M1]
MESNVKGDQTGVEFMVQDPPAFELEPGNDNLTVLETNTQDFTKHPHKLRRPQKQGMLCIAHLFTTHEQEDSASRPPHSCPQSTTSNAVQPPLDGSQPTQHPFPAASNEIQVPLDGSQPTQHPPPTFLDDARIEELVTNIDLDYLHPTDHPQAPLQLPSPMLPVARALTLFLNTPPANEPSVSVAQAPSPLPPSLLPVPASPNENNTYEFL